MREDQCWERSPTNQTQHPLRSVTLQVTVGLSNMERRHLSVELTEAIGLSNGKTGLEIGVYAQEMLQKVSFVDKTSRNNNDPR